MNNSTDTSYHLLDFQLIATTIFSTFSLIGLIGNIMVITVVRIIPGMLTPTNCYLVSLACSDCLFFLTTLPTEIATLYLPNNVFIFGPIACPISVYVPYLCINASSISIAAFTVERYIGICHPLVAKYICTVKRAIVIVATIWCFSIAYNSPWLIYVSLTPLNTTNPTGPQMCYFNLNRNEVIYRVMYMSDIFVFYLLPLLLCLALYGRIGYVLLTKTFVVDHSDTVQSDKKSLLNVAANFRQTKRQKPQQSDHRIASEKVTKSRKQVVKMLLVVVIVFALAWLPYRGLVLYNSFATNRFVNNWYLLFAKSCIFANSAANPILYSVMSKKFRTAFHLLFQKFGNNVVITSIIPLFYHNSAYSINVQRR